MTIPIIKVEQLNKVFSTDDMLTHALQGIDLEIQQGEYISISGPSGCGKSTLLSIMGLLDFATAGKLFFEGIDVSQLSLEQAAAIRNKKIGFIFQQFNLIDELSVYDNIALPLRYARQLASNKKIKEKVDYCLDVVGMTSLAGRKPTQLSGGQQQCIAIARALVADPAILLVDEPTGNLDSKNSDQIMATLEALNNQGTTLCVVTHDIRYAEMAKRKVYLLDGQVLGQTRLENQFKF
ncbi:MAG: putative ABC transport system ATP-binding protein [Cognaticolwellia sp.]|jgi:putative ABC transport system ATP-binding protein